MTERGERFIPPEAGEFKAPKTGVTKGPETEEGRQGMRGKPEATGAPTHRLGPDGELITTEKAELNHNQETTKDIQAGIGPNTSWSRDPNDTSSPTAQDDNAEKQEE